MPTPSAPPPREAIPRITLAGPLPSPATLKSRCTDGLRLNAASESAADGMPVSYAPACNPARAAGLGTGWETAAQLWTAVAMPAVGPEAVQESDEMTPPPDEAVAVAVPDA